MIGTTLSHFRITAELGRGGMGEVYRAEDTKLGREVAIKVLPEAFTRDPERLARFEREARVLASLDHPNIAAIHEVGQSDGTHFLAMQLAEGEDLSQRLERGPIAIDEAIQVALQIARALEGAHDSGVVHRDLKPANVKVGADGRVKVLDFGLAKSGVEKQDGDVDLSSSPTRTGRMTQAGAILGTFGYMSPEQTRGRTVDKRSDIWSFGCLLWECLTGRALFGGATTSDSIAGILQTEPNWSDLPPDTPPNVARLLRRCLAKDPGKRLHDIADARIELEDVDSDPYGERQPAPAEKRTTPLATIVAAAVAFVAVLTSALLYFSRPATDQSPHLLADKSVADNPLAGARFTRLTDFAGTEYDAAISPDGRFVTFVSNRDGPFEIFVGQIGQGEFRSLALGSDELTMQDARLPVRSVGFNGDGSEVWIGGGPWRRVRSTPLLGGPTRNYLGEHVVNVAWSPDGERIAYHERVEGDPLFVAHRTGADSRLVLPSPKGSHQHYPIWSVDGQWIYLARGRPTTLEMDLWRVRPDGGEPEKLTWGKLDVRYPTPLDEKTVLYSARDADGAGPWLWAVNVETRISRRATVGLEQYASVAASGDRHRLVATVQDPRAELLSVPILDRVATESDVEPLVDLPATRALAPRFSGSSLFYLSSRGSGDGLWRLRDGDVTEIWRGSETALLEPAAVSPDGESLVLLLRREDGWRLHVLSADGAQLRVLSESVDGRGSAAWSPDGQWVVTGGQVDEVRGLFKIPVSGGTPVRIVEGEALNPVWSSDGRLIAYTGAQVNVVSPLLAVRPDGEPVEVPHIEVFRSGERMRFLPDGSGLVYMSGLGWSQDFWLLDLATMSSRRLTQLDPRTTTRSFDVTPDGQRIVFDRLKANSDIVLIELRAN